MTHNNYKFSIVKIVKDLLFHAIKNELLREIYIYIWYASAL